MPALAVTLNGVPLVCVATDAFDVVDVGVSGDVLGPEYGILRVSAGSYPEGQESQYLIWEDERTLMPGDTVDVAFLADGATSRPGQTIEELYPRDRRTHKEPFVPPEEIVQELRQRPKAFESLAFEFTGPEGATAIVQTEPTEHGYGFTVLWDSHRPERARVAAHTYTLDSLIKRESGKYHAEAKLAFDQRVTFKMVTPKPRVESDARARLTRIR